MLRRTRERLRQVPPVLLVGLGAVLAALLVWGGVEAYRTYDYVQHDNDFCLSCHLMVDPYERFARSAHADLGCKSCHQPTLVTRSTMALTQIIENPDSLEAHAEVSNDVCVECHVEGDPEEWSNVAASAGHRVHLESDDPALSGLKCVECHSTSVHEFAATEQTCGQAGCHENQNIQLGAMGDLTIHCATCHTFNAQVAAEERDSVQLAFHPQREQCLSCHAMQVRLADFPPAEADPHAGMCASCHNPHDQAQSSDAFNACTDCHMQPDTLTPFHRGLGAGVLETCGRCHSAHSFHAEGRQCRDCHTDPTLRTPPTPAPNPHAPPRTSLGDGVLRVLGRLFLPAPAHAQQTRPAFPLQFDHARHTDVECTACHSVENTHGQVTTTTVQDCRSCHHTGSTMQPCSRCHDPAAVSSERYSVRRAFRPSVGRAENRTYPFDHRPHDDIDCGRCHVQGLELSAARVSCEGCHDEHHEPDNNCLACHETPASSAHTATAHLTCAGSGCHSPAPVTAAQRTRSLCLSCHQDMTDHQPGRRCVDCHALPAARQATGPAPASTPPSWVAAAAERVE
ncbi:MAG TPA: hypothetical protein VK912_12330 [Longimicrobiales bacterium]|nr:hypothetical protein [Longimicrobiales bacterium]